MVRGTGAASSLGELLVENSISYGVALVGSVGTALTLVGMLIGVMRPNLLSSRRFESLWFDAANTPILRVPAQAVQGFIDFAQAASRSTAARFRQFAGVLFVGGLSLFAVYFLFATLEGPAEALQRVLPFSLAVAVSLGAVVLIKIAGRSLLKLIDRVNLEDQYQRTTVRIEDLEVQLEIVADNVASSDPEDAVGRFWRREEEHLQRRLSWARERHDYIERRRGELGDIEGLVAEARSGTFWVFLATLLVVLWLGNLFWENFSPILMGVFDLPIGQALRIILFVTPTLLLIFIFLQTLVPAMQILASRDPKGTKSNSDPLNQSSIFLFLLGISLSLSLTFAALALGHLMEPEAPLPQTLQLVFFNGVFDGLTLMVTIWILRRATQIRGSIRSVTTNLVLSVRVVLAILIDLALAAILAVLSLYFGLLASDLQINFGEAFNILVGLSPDGTQVQFGPYFWVMHTAFIPTAAYLIALVILMLMKMIAFIFLRLLQGRLGRAIPATGALLTAIAGLLGYLLVLAGDHGVFSL